MGKAVRYLKHTMILHMFNAGSVLQQSPEWARCAAKFLWVNIDSSK